MCRQIKLNCAFRANSRFRFIIIDIRLKLPFLELALNLVLWRNFILMQRFGYLFVLYIVYLLFHTIQRLEI